MLLAERIIERCATEPHQEHIDKVTDLVWRMCVSYRGLNRVTNPFEYPIGRCDDAIEDVGDGTQYVYFVSVDSANGYHQIKVRRCDREKLAFFSPDDEKYTWSVHMQNACNATRGHDALPHDL